MPGTTLRHQVMAVITEAREEHRHSIEAMSDAYLAERITAYFAQNTINKARDLGEKGFTDLDEAMRYMIHELFSIDLDAHTDTQQPTSRVIHRAFTNTEELAP